METKIVYWAKFYSPDIMVANTWNKDLEKLTYPEEVPFPDNAYCFQLFKREDVINDGKTYQGKPEQIGKMYYHPDSKVRTLEEVREMRGNNQILIRNMECNKWDSVIFTRWDNWAQPYNENEIEILKK